MLNSDEVKQCRLHCAALQEEPQQQQTADACWREPAGAEFGSTSPCKAQLQVQTATAGKRGQNRGETVPGEDAMRDRR